ncbi:MAG: DNA-directed RNA polymerase subunit alpha [Chryseobacterium sp.]|nr:DNA-directed RNA polymerase subunit alpha [Chryseobacterium sp.]
MAILTFIKPDKVILIKSDDFKGQFEFRPLESGFGLTIGNALRRVLLSSLEGYAISSIKIEGVEHEFSTIKGVIEDVTEIVLNLKQLRLKATTENASAEQVTVKLSGKEVITAGDLGSSISGFEVLNPELMICNLTKDITFEMTFNIEKGRGYVPSDQNKTANAVLGTIAIDSIFTPIKKVQYSVENYRVEQKTDYEKLILDIETDGSISPQNALTEASKILIYHFMLFSDERITLETEAVKASIQYDEETLHTRQLLKSKLADMDLSVRALNCLKAAEVETLGELVSYSKSDLMKFRNFGKKSLTELEELVHAKGLNFGFDVAKYKLDADK